MFSIQFTSVIYFFTIVYLVNSNVKNNDIDNYKATINYIINSTELQKSFEDALIEKQDTPSIHVSKELLSFNANHFLYEIISKEFPNSTRYEFENLYDALSIYYNNNGKVILDSNSNISEIYKNESFNIIVFFSEQVDNKIIAELRPYNSKSYMKFDNGKFIGYKDNLNYFDAVEQGDYLQFLFYVECGKVIEAFHKMVTTK